MGTKKIIQISLAAIFAASSLGAEEIERQIDDTQDVPRGFYAALSSGYFMFLNDGDRSQYGDGWLVGLKFGYDILKYLSVEASYRSSGHQNAQRGVAAQSIPASHFSHQITGMVRGNWPATRRWTFSLDGGGGVWYTRPNIKPTISEAYRGMVTAGLGVQYFTKIKGIVIGIDPSLSYAGDLEGLILQSTGYIRYTF